jgi:hypothetical protein
MRSTFRIREYFATLLVAAMPAGAAVTVTFGPGPYSDTGPPGAETEKVKDEIARHLQALGSRYLAPQDNLRIEVLDVDLAGELQLSRSTGREIRIARGKADFPRIKLRYALEAGAKSASGEETISDTSYLWFPARGRESESLYHEKRLLDSWFKQHFAR